MQTWGRIPGKSMQMCLSRLSSHAGPWAPRWSLPKAQLLFLAQGLLGRQRHHRKQGPSVTDGWFGIKSGGPQLERGKHKYTLQVLRSGPRWVSACWALGWSLQRELRMHIQFSGHHSSYLQSPLLLSNQTKRFVWLTGSSPSSREAQGRS